MTQKLHGGCACGAIKYEAAADPVTMLNCHCRHCQRASGSAYAAIVVFDKGAVTLSSEPKYHASTGISGNRVDRGFCPECGNPVSIKLEALPNILGIQAATLDDPALFKPAVDLFTASAQGWDQMHPDLPKHPQGPPRRK
jgi:hypothetical protein